jgi:hypothetical protein
MSAHFVHGDVKGVKQQDGSPRNTDPFFVMLGCSTTEDRLLKPSEGLKW